MLEFHEPTFFDVNHYQSSCTDRSPGFDPFEDANESILEWAANTRARLAAKRAAKLKGLNRDRSLDDLPVIEASSSLLNDESLPVIEAIEAVSVDENGQGVERDRGLPVIEDRNGGYPQAIPKQSKSKNSGCIGTYRKGKSEYYRYSYRIEGKVRHKHIGSVSDKLTRHRVGVIKRWILTEIPSRWILANFFDGPDYPAERDDFSSAYEKLASFPYELPPLPSSPCDNPKQPKSRLEEL